MLIKLQAINILSSVYLLVVHGSCYQINVKVGIICYVAPESRLQGTVCSCDMVEWGVMQ